MALKTSILGINLVKHYETIHDGDLTKIGLQPKICPAGIWTVGYGRALRNNKGIYLTGEKDRVAAYSLFPKLTIGEAEQMLIQDLSVREIRLNSLNLNLKQYEFDALISFIYNIGFGNFCQSSLLRNVQQKTKFINNCFSVWNKARIDGKLTTLKGLTLRRQSEAILFLTGKLKSTRNKTFTPCQFFF
jgi:lysozyme